MLLEDPRRRRGGRATRARRRLQGSAPPRARAPVVTAGSRGVRMIAAPRRIWRARRPTSTDAPARIARVEARSRQRATANTATATATTHAISRCAKWMPTRKSQSGGQKAAVGRRPRKRRYRKPRKAVAHDGGDPELEEDEGAAGDPRPAHGVPRADRPRDPAPAASDGDGDQRAGEGLREAGVEHREEPAEARVDRRDLHGVEPHPQPARRRPARRRGPPRRGRAREAMAGTRAARSRRRGRPSGRS